MKSQYLFKMPLASSSTFVVGWGILKSAGPSQDPARKVAEMKIGVVVGRFQVQSLHEGQRFVINKAFENHRKVIIFIGCPPIEGTRHEPLDYPTRYRMIQSEYPDAIILPQFDCRSDVEWGNNLDTQIRGIVPNVTEAVIYGGRDSFKKHYNGTFTAIELDSGINYRSGSEQREDIGKVVRNNADFRAGIIYSTQNSWPSVKMCTDIAVIRTAGGPGGTEILLGQKKSEEGKWRLPGGMVDKGETLEQCACRELAEETSLYVEIKNLEYVSSVPSGDWRFKNAGEIGLMTALFLHSAPVFGAAQAKSDLVKVKWEPLDGAEKITVKSHKALIVAVQERLNK